MDRRTFLKSAVGASALATAGGLATPAISQRATCAALRAAGRSRQLRSGVERAAFVARNASVMVWDTLYGVNDKLQPQRQPYRDSNFERSMLSGVAPSRSPR